MWQKPQFDLKKKDKLTNIAETAMLFLQAYFDQGLKQHYQVLDFPVFLHYVHGLHS